LKRVGTPGLFVNAFDADGLILVRYFVPVERLPLLVFLVRVAAVPHDVREVHGDIAAIALLGVGYLGYKLIEAWRAQGKTTLVVKTEEGYRRVRGK